jgi:hypothetical protein
MVEAAADEMAFAGSAMRDSRAKGALLSRPRRAEV